MYDPYDFVTVENCLKNLHVCLHSVRAVHVLFLKQLEFLASTCRAAIAVILYSSAILFSIVANILLPASRAMPLSPRSMIFKKSRGEG